jgi:hypothetical protein
MSLGYVHQPRDGMNRIRRLTLVSALILAACAEMPSGIEPGEVGIDGVPCIGIVRGEPGLNEGMNDALLARTQGKSGKGGVCAAKVFSVTSPVTLYRVFDAGNPHSRLGSWWTLAAPSGSREEYRAQNAIGTEWSKLDRLVSCEVRPGSEVVLGTTQSAICADGSTYGKTGAIQVFVANDARIGILHVGACRENEIWR